MDMFWLLSAVFYDVMRRELVLRSALITSLAIVVLATARTPAQTGTSTTSARWWSHVQALANDGMEGRNTGSPGHKRAAEYVATQLEKARLEPAGTSGYLQPVRFKTRRIVEERSSLALVRDGNVEPLTLGEDANFGMRIEPASSVDAPLVFVGYGLKIPEQKIDDFDGLNLKGAIV